MLVMQSQAKIDPKNIVGIWFFDEGQGDTAKDISENGNHAKLVDAKWTDGKRGKGVEFDGTNHVKIAASKSTDDYLDGFTYCLWMKSMRIHGNDHCRVIERNWHNPGIYIGSKDFFASIVSGGAMQPVVGQNRGGKPDLTNNADGGAIYLAQYKRAGWDYVGVIDEVGVLNKGLSADTLNDISSKGLEKAMSVSTENRFTTTWGDLKAFHHY